MADFCQWIIACEVELPWEMSSFLKVYLENKSLAEEDLLASEVLVAVLEKFIEVTTPDGNGVYFEGTPTELLEELQGTLSI